MASIRSNHSIGWLCIAIGIGSGLLMGLWSFDGPVTTPAFLGDYGSTSRRLLRLGHIAWIGIGILNILLARELTTSRLPAARRAAASTLMNIGNLALPSTLFAAAVWQPLKYAMAPAALCVFAAAVLAATGAGGADDRDEAP